MPLPERHSASTTLDDIITELKLSYDSSVGLLDGSYVQKIPKANVLLNLNKLLKNFASQLQLVEQTDAVVLRKIKRELSGSEGADIEDDEDMDTNADGVENKSGEEEDDDESDDEEDTRNNSIITTNNNEDDEMGESDLGDENRSGWDSGKKRGASKLLANDHRENGAQQDGEEDDDDDEDDVGLSKRRKLNSHINIETLDDTAAISNGKGTEDDAKDPPINSKDDAVPPVQQGSFTQDNDTRLKNPKSEFVTSQTLPAKAIAQLGLFSEDNNGLETHGKEYLKKKYGVASYPQLDLYDLLPGPIPDLDFSKNKPPTNQVQFTTFQTYIESFFRLFVPEDIDFLREKHILPAGFDKSYDPNVTPFVMPKLGPFYAEAWAAEDATLGSKLNSPGYSHGVDSYIPKGSIDNLSDDKLYTEEVSCGPLSSRLLSAILCNNDEGMDAATTNTSMDDVKEESEDVENIPVPNNSQDLDVATQLNISDAYKLDSEKSDFHSIEERLKRELKYIGIFMNLPKSDNKEGKKGNSHSRKGSTVNPSENIVDNDDWIKNREDDEVCAEIRALQKELQEASARNRKHKKKLIPIVEDQIAYQEYCTILDDLDKQVDQAYIKRLRVKNKKKKTEVSPAVTQLTVNSGLLTLMDKRKKWVNNIGKLFKSPELMKRAPTESILEGNVDSDDEGDDDVEHVDAAENIIADK